MKVVTKYKTILFVLTLLAVVCIISLFYFWNPADSIIFPKCLFYSATNLYCPGCGSQRAIHQLLHGKLFIGLKHNYLIGLLAIVLSYQLYVFISEVYFNKTIKNLLHKPISTQLILVVVVLFWVFRNIPYYPFILLAP
ncbi:MAG TPA: DUF2752 domain-containing protein [Xanthomarina sp.]|nr:DUF2752 domain-containing protein [Xanthomarina sp.]